MSGDNGANITRGPSFPPNLVIPYTYPRGTPGDGILPRQKAPTLAALWFFCWQFAPTEVLRARAGESRDDLEALLIQTQLKNEGFGVLLDQTGRAEFFLTRQVNQAEASRIFHEWFNKKAKDHRKPADRVEWDGGKFIRRTQESGAWQAYYEAEEAEDKESPGA